MTYPKVIDALNEFGLKLRQAGVESAVVQLPGYTFNELEAYWKTICTFKVRFDPAEGPEGVRWKRSATLRTPGATLVIEDM